MRLRGFLVVVYIVGILFWFEDTSFTGLSNQLKALYLVVLPGAGWLVLTFIGRRWHPRPTVERWLFRIATITVAAALFAGAGLATQGDSHLECTDLGREGECVGDIISVPGPNIRVISSLVLGGAISLFVGWFAIKDDVSE